MGQKSKYNYQYVKNIVKEKGGELLSKEYKNTKTKILVRCGIGHVWSTSFGRIFYVESWCPECANDRIAKSNTKYSQKYVSNYLNAMGWVLLSGYKSVNDYIKIECTKCDWKWETRFSKILEGSKCKRCSHTTNSILGANSFAKNKGGKCLSEKYINCKTSMTWQCQNGHTWVAKFSDIKSGSWCPNCRVFKTQKKLSNMVKEVFGTQVYENYKGFNWLKNKTGYRMEIDVWVPELKLAIEYDGEQHFKPVNFGGSKQSSKNNFDSTVKRDKLKNRLIKKSNDVKYFVRFNYKEPITKEYVLEKLIKSGVPINVNSNN